MLQLFSPRVCITLVIFTYMLMTISVGLAGFTLDDWRLYSISLNITIILLALFKKTRLFLILWHTEKWGLGTKLGTWIGPDLEGNYEAVFQSNFALRQGGEQTLVPPPAPRPVSIRVTWEKIVIDMESGDKPSESSSKSLPASIRKNKDGGIELEYLYHGKVPNPTAPDDREYDGAAKLTYESKNGIVRLTGCYWTNRAYQRGLNTAGSITLTRVQ